MTINSTDIRDITARMQRPRTLRVFKAIGIDLTDHNGKFIGLYEALQKISLALESIDSDDPIMAYIVESLGGMRQMCKIMSLIERATNADDGTSDDKDTTERQEETFEEYMEAMKLLIESVEECTKTIEDGTAKIEAFQARLVAIESRMAMLEARVAAMAIPSLTPSCLMVVPSPQQTTHPYQPITVPYTRPVTTYSPWNNLPPAVTWG